MSRPFLTGLPDGHCAKLAEKYLIRDIEKQMKPYIKAYLQNFHIKKTKANPTVYNKKDQLIPGALFMYTRGAIHVKKTIRLEAVVFLRITDPNSSPPQHITMEMISSAQQQGG